MVADVENPVSDVSLDIESLEKELNNSDWSRGWEQGRIDMMKQMKENFLPRNDQVLRSAEIVVNIMKKKFGDVFGRIFAGFNGHFDEPAVLLCLKEGADCKRIDVVSFGVDVSLEMSEHGLVPLHVMATRSESTDFDSVVKDFQFERK